MNNLIKIFITILILSVCYLGLTSFKKLNEKTKTGTFNLIYIDNSKMEGTAGLSSNMIEYINTQADSVKKNNFLMFLSNNTSPQYVKSAEFINQFLNKLVEGNTKFPNAIEDKKQLWSILLRGEDLKKYATINIRLYITENYLRNGLLNDNPGLFLKFFPKEIATIANLDESNVHVYINYSPELKSKFIKPLTELEIKKSISFFT
jgi:hypothetical protein